MVPGEPRQFRIPDWFLNRQKDFKDANTLSRPPTRRYQLAMTSSA